MARVTVRIHTNAIDHRGRPIHLCVAEALRDVARFFEEQPDDTQALSPRLHPLRNKRDVVPLFIGAIEITEEAPE